MSRVLSFFWKPSFILFFITIIIYLLQLFPLTGIFLMMLAAPFWSAFTINAGFISMTIESLAGLLPRWFLLFPIIYFGGYAVLTGLSHYKYYSLQEDIAEYNAQIKIPFKLSENDLVLPSEMNPGLFLTSYGFASVYKSNKNFRPKAHIVSTIGDKKACQAAREIGFSNGFFARPIRSYNRKNNKGFYERLGKTIPGLCLVNYPQDPKKPTYVIRMTQEKNDSILLPVKLNSIIIDDPFGDKSILKGGFANPYKWYPLPFLGCGLNSGAASWDCFHGFAREGFRPLNKGTGRFSGDPWIVAESLGLKALTEEEKYRPNITAMEIAALAKKIQEDKEKDAYARFEKLLSSPLSYDDSVDFSTIEHDEKLFIARIAKIINALSLLRLDHTKEGMKKKLFLSQTLANLPLHILRSNSTSLISLVDSYADTQGPLRIWILIIRMGELGREVIPVFKKLMENHHIYRHGSLGLPNTSLVYAVCRVGAEIKDFAGNRFLNELKKVSRYSGRNEDKRALYLALSRMDLKDEASKILTISDMGPYRSGAEFISASSPSSVCVDVEGEPKFPD